MAKIYIKTIFLTASLIFLVLLRFGFLTFDLHIPLPLADFLCLIIFASIIINEKLTKGERWTRFHYLLLLIVAVFVGVVIAKIYSL